MYSAHNPNTGKETGGHTSEELGTADDIFIFIMIFYELWKQKKYIDSSLTSCFCKFLNVLYFVTIVIFIDFIDVQYTFFTNLSMLHTLQKMSKIKCSGLFDWSYSEGIKSNWQALKVSPYLIRSYYGVFLHHSRQRDCNSLQEV
jgi:hypothetical protein